MSEMFLVRHAQASFGSADYDCLSELGHQQARWLGEYFHYRGLEFDRLICGSMKRHLETAESIASGMGPACPDVRINADWNEFDFESLIYAYLEQHPAERPAEDAPKSVFLRLLRKSLLAWSEDRIGDDAPERWADFEQRVSAALAAATGPGEPGRKILVVSSGGAISMAVRQVLQAPSEAMIQMNLQTRNSGFSHLFFNDRTIQLSGFNHAPHLDHPERDGTVTYF